MPTISGTVYDDTGAPAANRTVRAYRRDTGAFLAEVATGDGSSVPDDPNYANVSLLLHMDGTNGSTVFTDVSPVPKVVTRVGDAQISTAQSKFGGSSALFDGTGDYITVPYSSDFDFGSGNFTIELWVYRTGANANASRLWNANGDFFHQCEIGIDGSGVLSSYGTTTGSTWNAWSAPSIGSVTANQWVHLAIVRNGGTVTGYINGTGVVLTSSLGGAALVNGTNGATTRSIGGQAGTNRSLFGYIDEFRVTKGVARYTANFTPPSQPFSPPTPDDPHLSSVSLLLPMDTVPSLTTFTDRSPTPKAVTRFGDTVLSPVQSKFGGYSGFFDGSGDYLQTPLDPSLQFGTGDFTIELWFYRSANATRQDLLGCYLASPLGGYGVATSFSTAGDVHLFWGNTSVATTAGGVWAINTWNHVAITRSGTTTRIFVNGVVAATNASDSTNYTGGNPLQVGSNGISTLVLNGYIDDLRITKGTARYTANFTPPTAAFPTASPDDPDFANVSLLLPMDLGVNTTTFVDRSPSTKTVTRTGDAVISTVQSKFGGASAYFDGTGDYLTVTPEIELSNSQFTMECWIRTSQTAQYRPMFSRRPTTWGSGMWAGYVNGTASTGDIQFWAHNFSVSVPLLQTTGVSVIDNEWHHIAVVRGPDGAWVLYVDGVTRATATWTGTIATIAGGVQIGGEPNTTRWYLGYIDDFRITLGVARYTTNFNPPTRSGFSVNPMPIGQYEINTAHTGECNVLCLDDAAGTVYEDLCRRATPV